MTDLDELNLWHEQQLVGYLWRNDLDRIGFRYDEDWLVTQPQFPISLQLPLRENEFSPDDGIAHRFFANLLPEGQARANIVSSLKISNSDFALLKAIGGECAGAFNILPFASVPAPPSDWKYELLSRDRLQALIRRRGQIYSFGKNDGAPIRSSLAGAQDKCPVLLKDGEYYLPENGAPTSHILKFQVPGLSHVPAFETVLTRLAKSLDMPAVDIELRALDGLPADNPADSFVEIKRYDRYQDDSGRTHRLHQEDFCQALGFGHERKYEAEGGPCFSDCLTLIRDVSDEPAFDAQFLIQWQIFNFLAGNSDGHAKNLSLLYSEESSLRLAPFYDLVCTRAIEHLDHNLAFSIGGQHGPGNIMKSNWSDFARENDISQRYLFGLVKQQAEQLLDTIAGVLVKFTDDYGTYNALQRVRIVVESQCKRTLKDIKPV